MALQYVGGATATKAGATSGNSTISLTSLTGGISSFCCCWRHRNCRVCDRLHGRPHAVNYRWHKRLHACRVRALCKQHNRHKPARCVQATDWGRRKRNIWANRKRCRRGCDGRACLARGRHGNAAGCYSNHGNRHIYRASKPSGYHALYVGVGCHCRGRSICWNGRSFHIERPIQLQNCNERRHLRCHDRHWLVCVDIRCIRPRAIRWRDDRCRRVLGGDHACAAPGASASCGVLGY